MSQSNDRFDDALKSMARGYNQPPELKREDLDDMWSTIERDALGGGTTFGPRRWYAARNLMALAATLVLGVFLGRYSAADRGADLPATTVASRTADSLRVPGPYHSTTSRYLGQAAALLVSLPAEVSAGRADEPYLGRAHDLLLTTRLLLDSPASADPRFRALLEDLELVLAQVVRLQSVQSADELDLIRQALEQRDVLPRLRTAAANISADD